MNLAHVRDRPFVIGIVPFDRPHAHLAANRTIVTALYGVYYDEATTIAMQADNVVRHDIEAIAKHASANVPVGLFANDEFKEVSAVVFGPLATWGKLRALADSPERKSVFTTLHPAHEGLIPTIRNTAKSDYVEHLLDGLYVFHNPYAEHPLPVEIFSHERIARFEARSDGSVEEVAPADFLLMRMERTINGGFPA